MNKASLIKLKSVVQDLIHKKIKPESKDKSIAFYIGLIESIFSHKTLLYKIILDDAKTLINNIENATFKLNDSIAISAILALHLLKSNNQKVKKKINTYLNSRLSDFEYSPLKNSMLLFLICQGLDYLESSIKDVISNKLTSLLNVPHTLENSLLIYASFLILNKNNNKNVREKLIKNVIQYEPIEMNLSQGIYALWFYEIFISSYINSYDQDLKPQILKWNRELKREIMPQLIKEFMLRNVKNSIDEDLTNIQLSISTFELALIYETILKNEDKFLIISQQDFTNSLIEKSKKNIFKRVKWQSYFWILLLMAFFTLPWCLLGKFILQVLITGVMGVLFTTIIFFLRYKHIKYLLIQRKEWITSNYKSLLSSLLFGILVTYIASFVDVKRIFPRFPKTIHVFIIPCLGVLAILLSHVIDPIKNILNDLLFSIKVFDELNDDGDYETK